ncbi:MAG: VacJ family lipoprotein [Phycisphaerae bacterium]|nr:VacJ family lipoprotein [Phycisphaerae bacterium]
MRYLTWGAVILVAAVAGCGGPEASWWRSGSAAPPEEAVSLADHREGDTASDRRVDAGLDGGGKVDEVDGVDEFDEFDEIDKELSERMVEVPDPLKGWNRAMFQFNDRLYFWVAKPVLEGYAKVVPEDARIGIRNSFDNVKMPVRLVNCLLQGRWEASGIELRRFGINTTLGVLGFVDVARKDYGLEPVQADMGETFAVHGLGEGCYLVWPVLGPSTVRDTVGSIPDMFLNPLHYVRPWWVSLGVSGLKITNNGSLQVGVYEALTSDAVDPYVAVRQAYMQYRRKQLERAAAVPESEAGSAEEAVGPPMPAGWHPEGGQP